MCLHISPQRARKVAQELVVVLVKLEVWRPLSEGAGAGQDGVPEDAAGALARVQLKPDVRNRFLNSFSQGFLQTFRVFCCCSGKPETDVYILITWCHSHVVQF